MKKSRSILMIAYYFPPNGTIAFLRNYHISKYLKPYFNKIKIITLKNPPFTLQDKIKTDDKNIHRVYNFDYRNFINLFSQKKDLRKKANEYSNKKRVKITRFFLDSFPFNVLIGEGGLIYIFFATIKGIALIKKYKITHLYSSFRPIADHIIAFYLKLIFPNLIWIADFRDPPITGKVKFPLISGWQTKLIRKILSKADIVTSVSNGVNKSLTKYNCNSITFRNGIYELFKKENTHYSKFTISYTGSLYPDFQKPSILFKSINELIKEKHIDANSIQLIYAGKDNAIWQNLIKENNLNSISIINAEISLSESIKIQSKSHINLLLTWTTDNRTGIITGKFFEYLSTKNPVLAIINGQKDKEIESIFSELNAGQVFYPNEIKNIKNYLLEYYNQWQQSGKLNFIPNENKLNELKWENQIKSLVQLL